MTPDYRQRLEHNFSSVYITIVSVMLGLALDDAVSIIRDVRHIDPFTALTAAFTLIVIFNAWVGYSMSASIARLVPSVWDALNVFALSFAHFALNTAIGASPETFFAIAGGYSLIAGCVVYYNARRIAQDRTLVDFNYEVFRRLIALNGIGGAGFLLTAVLVSNGVIPGSAQVMLAGLGIVFALAWIALFLSTWRRAGLPVWNRP